MIKKKIKAAFKQFLVSGMFASPENYLRKYGVKIGKGCLIDSCKIVIEEGFLIEIGDFVRIAENARFFTHGLIIILREKYDDPNLDYFGKIKIGSYTAIGEGVRIMPGVTIGENVIIGAGSIVTKSIPDNCMVAGNPIKYICSTDEYYQKIKNNDLKSGLMDAKEKIAFLRSLPDDAFTKRPYISNREEYL